MGGRESEHLIVPVKVGNRDRQGPTGGKGMPEGGTDGGKDSWEIQPGECLNETTSDSGAGEEEPGDGDDDAVPPH